MNIFNPEAIVIGGGWGEAADEYLLEPARELVRLLPAELGPDAGLVGAGLVAFEALDADEAW